MPYIQRRRIKPRTNLANDAGTYQLELPRQGLCNALSLFFEWTNGATSCKDEDIYDAIDRIKILGNGSRVLYSLTGQQARLWSHVHLGQRPMYVRDETPDVVQMAHVFIPFGLHRYDENHYFDFVRFNDVELQIEYSPTIAATSFATGTGYVTVYADMWYGGNPGAFDGFLRHHEIKWFLSAASGDEVIDLSLGELLLGLGIYVYEAGVPPETNVDSLKLEINNGEQIAVEGLFETLQQRMHELIPINPLERGIVYKSDTDVIYTRTGTAGQVFKDRIQSVTIGVTDQQQDIFSGYAGGGATLQTLDRDAASVAADAASVADGQVKWLAQPKYGLGNFLVLPFGFPTYPQFGLPTSQFGRAQLFLTQGNAGAEVRVSQLELVKD